MNKLEGRVTKLEQAQPAEEPLVIIVQFVAPRGQEHLEDDETGYPPIDEQITAQRAAMKPRDKNALVVFEPKVMTLATLDERRDA